MLQTHSAEDNTSWVSEAGTVHSGDILAAKDDVNVIACASCGFTHVVPLPSAEWLKNFYETEFYQEEKTDYLSMDIDETSWRALEFGARFDFIERFIPQGIRSVLDIGCGPGDFLKTAQQRGWKAHGVEPSPAASEFARGQGVDVQTGFFGPATFVEQTEFDFIHMSEVLEHVADPREVVACAMQCLRPGGIICISVPNDFNAFQKSVVAQSNADEWWVVPDHHLNYFSFETLENLLVSEGLDLLERTTNFPMELFLLMGQDYTSDPKLGSKLHGWRKNFDRSTANSGPLRQDFYRALAQANLGRLSIVFARKKEVS